MDKVDKLIKKVKQIQRAVKRILFYREGICERCNERIDKCQCKPTYGDNITIDFVRCRSREEAIEWQEKKESD